jgi:hypothetical protein
LCSPPGPGALWPRRLQPLERVTDLQPDDTRHVDGRQAAPDDEHDAFAAVELGARIRFLREHATDLGPAHLAAHVGRVAALRQLLYRVGDRLADDVRDSVLRASAVVVPGEEVRAREQGPDEKQRSTSQSQSSVRRGGGPAS